jgi:hypothetical protein
LSFLNKFKISKISNNFQNSARRGFLALESNGKTILGPSEEKGCAILFWGISISPFVPNGSASYLGEL